MSTFADRLAEAVQKRGPLCIGIDPRWDSLPLELRNKHADDGVSGQAAAFLEFGEFLIRELHPYCACIKPQAAFFEQLGPAGAAPLHALIQLARDEFNLLTILDAKRGDIASTATAYAHSAFLGYGADALTVNPYLGADAVEPFISTARSSMPARGIFVLVRTSNPGGGLFQNLNCEGRPLYRIVGDEVAKWNRGGAGHCGLGDVGAVVGATNPQELKQLRKDLPQVWFLVPGYGAQGGTAADVKAAYLPNGLGGIINSSRGVTFAFHPDDPNWRPKTIDAAKKAQAELKA